MARRWHCLTMVLLLSLLAVHAPRAHAGFVGPGPSPAVVTAAEAGTLPDDAAVMLQGYIERHLREDHYLFRDITGTITVDIDDDKWGGFVVKPTDKIELWGEIDRDFLSVEVEVEGLRIMEE